MHHGFHTSRGSGQGRLSSRVATLLALLTCASALLSACSAEKAASHSSPPAKKAAALNDAFLEAEKAVEALPGAAVFRDHCNGCHDGSVARAPLRRMMKLMTPESVMRTLTTGVMRVPGAGLTGQERVEVAEYLTGRKPGTAPPAKLPFCSDEKRRFDYADGPAGVNWSLTAENTRFIPASAAGITAGDLPHLKLKWAFAFPEAQRVRSEPALVGGAAIMGSHNGTVYALNRETGCVRWTFSASAEVQPGVAVSSWRAGSKTEKPLAFFGDGLGKLYAVDATNGKLVWSDRPDPHASAKLTAGPVYHQGLLYVPVSSEEIAAAGNPAYQCCTFRGQVVAYDARTGKVVWRAYTTPEPTPQGKNAAGATRYGPSGAPVWNTPTIDVKRGLLYFGTGQNYSDPASSTSDSVIAVDLKTGRRKWVYQALAGDAWNMSCGTSQSANCPSKPGPDFDISAPPVLVHLKSGKDILVVGQKSGTVHGVNPDDGALVWKQQVGRGGLLGGVHFSLAAEGDRVYVPIADTNVGVAYSTAARPGLYALDAATGRYLWRYPLENHCGERPLCHPGISEAITASSGMVMSGAIDGMLRINDGRTGKLLWAYDSTKPVRSVSGVIGKGGSFGGGAGPLMKNGLLFVSSGYGYSIDTPGNVLLVFDIDRQGAGPAAAP